MKPRPRLLAPVPITGWDWPQVMRACKGDIERHTHWVVYTAVSHEARPIHDPLVGLRVWTQMGIHDVLPLGPEGAPP